MQVLSCSKMAKPHNKDMERLGMIPSRCSKQTKELQHFHFSILFFIFITFSLSFKKSVQNNLQLAPPCSLIFITAFFLSHLFLLLPSSSDVCSSALLYSFHPFLNVFISSSHLISLPSFTGCSINLKSDPLLISRKAG